MENKKISKFVLKRLPGYLSYLKVCRKMRLPIFLPPPLQMPWGWVRFRSVRIWLWSLMEAVPRSVTCALP